MQQNRKSLLDSIDSKASSFIEEGKPKPKQEKVETQNAPIAENASLTLKPFTCMVSSDLIDEMMMLSATRKIIKQRPYSQKDIIAEALSDWINKNK